METSLLWVILIYSRQVLRQTNWQHFCYLFDLSNLIKQKTCFTKCHKSLIVLILKKGLSPSNMPELRNWFKRFSWTHFYIFQMSEFPTKTQSHPLQKLQKLH